MQKFNLAQNYNTSRGQEQTTERSKLFVSWLLVQSVGVTLGSLG
jgi:hypothetical protein